MTRAATILSVSICRSMFARTVSPAMVEGGKTKIGPSVTFPDLFLI